MPHSTDVAEYILQRQSSMTAMKLQKLVYYSHVWSLVWDEQPLVTDRIEAWANGPVAPELYERHRGEFRISTVGGDPTRLDETQRETIDKVLEYYGHRSSQWLSDLTHAEDPWRNARGGLAAGVRSNARISDAAMAEYYGSL
jgi:uncharacterized phage-associated protein